MRGEPLALALLAAVLAMAVVRPRGLPEALVAVPAAGMTFVLGLVSTSAVHDEIARLLPVLVFLAAIFVLARMCAVEGVFTATGDWLARSSGDSSRRLLLHVFAVGAVVTSVLSLDATAVLLTPVVAATAIRMEVPPKPHVYATGHLANSASLLLPMGNLTNLLALAASGLTLVHFAALMVIPWLVVLLVEYLVLRLVFRRDLPAIATDHDPNESRTPLFALLVLAATLAGFVATSLLSVEPYWAAIAGALVLTGHALTKRLVEVSSVFTAMDLPFVAFVMGLAVVVRAAVDQGLGPWIDDRLPDSDALPALLMLALVGAILANVVNNLPALLILLPFATAISPLAVLVALIGVNIGPNLVYTGSLATLLWRRVATEHGVPPTLRQFTVLGLATVPAAVGLGVVALWAWSLALPFA